MDKFDKKLVEMGAGEPIDAPEGFDARLEAAIAGAAESFGRVNGGPRRRAWAARPVRVLIAAALAVCALGGTALAVSPSLRELLWGGFEPYTQELEVTAENTQVYDGVEARIASALSDGYVNIIEIRLRDLEGDRVRQAWERYRETGENEFKDSVRFARVLETDTLREESLASAGAFSMGGSSAGLAARPVSFDEGTGVLTLKAALFTAAPARIERQAQVEIDTGTAGTREQVEHHSTDASWDRRTLVDGAEISGESGTGEEWDTPVVGWELTATLTGLSGRDVALDRVRVDAAEVLSRDGGEQSAAVDTAMYLTSARVSEMAVTLCREGDGVSETRLAPDELTVVFRDGAEQVLAGAWKSHFYARFEIDGEAVNTDTWIFPEPVDPESVAAVRLGGTKIELG